MGLKPGMRTISQQEAERRGPPSPHAQMSLWPVQSAVSTTPKETQEFFKRQQTQAFFFGIFIKDIFIFDMSYSYIIKKINVTKILKGTFFFFFKYKGVLEQSDWRALFWFSTQF